MNAERVFVIALALLMGGLGVVFLTFPRSTFSAIEHRELQRPPQFTWQGLADGSYTAEVSEWFSDSQPFRDVFMSLHMRLRSAQAVHWGQDEAITFHATASAQPQGEADEQASGSEPSPLQEAQSVSPANAHIANAGIIVVGSAPTARALMAFSGRSRGAVAYAQAINSFAREVGEGVRVGCMPVPTSVEFYCPPQARSASVEERPVLDTLLATLSPQVMGIDLYDTLLCHQSEPIYLRTDHHWAPLGAYYAARCYAQCAGVTVPQLRQFLPHTVPGFVGSMFGYSQDPAVKDSPEDFVYYTPQHPYTTHYTVFRLDEQFHVTDTAGIQRQGAFFVEQSASSGNAYSTFMGGDARITRVVTPDTGTSRRLLIIKDSFGNAVPGYLFASFQEVHVIDFRYFPRSIWAYIADHAITDVLFVNNLSHACSGGVTQAYRQWLSHDGPSS